MPKDHPWSSIIVMFVIALITSDCCLFQLYRASALFETIRHEAQHSTDYKLSLFDLQTSCYQALQRVLVSLGMRINHLSHSHSFMPSGFCLRMQEFLEFSCISTDFWLPQATTMRLWQWQSGVAPELSLTCWWRGRRASRTQTPTPQWRWSTSWTPSTARGPWCFISPWLLVTFTAGCWLQGQVNTDSLLDLLFRCLVGRLKLGSFLLWNMSLASAAICARIIKADGWVSNVSFNSGNSCQYALFFLIVAHLGQIIWSNFHFYAKLIFLPLLILSCSIPW